MGIGGAERVAANLVNAWSERGDIVTLVITFSGRGRCLYPISSRVKLVYLADIAGHKGRGPISYLYRFWALRGLINSSRAEVVISFLTNVNVAVLLASVGSRCSVFVSERTHPPARRIGWLLSVLRHLTYRWASSVVMLTTEGLLWLESSISTAKGVVIPNPVLVPMQRGDPVLRPDVVLVADRRLLLAVGRLDQGKQFDRLLESFSNLAPRYPAWDLVILGEGVEGGRLRQQVESLKLTGRVSLPGSVGNVADWYERADLYVMSSRFEGFPNTLAEAMAHGCAAVSYDCDTGPRDIIRHEQDGLLVSPVGNVMALTQALDRLMGDEAERRRMATRASEVRERYSMASVLTMWDRLFEAHPTLPRHR